MLLQGVRGIGLRFFRERAQDCRCHIRQDDTCFAYIQISVNVLQPPRNHIAQCAGRLATGRASPDDDEVQRPFVQERRIAIGRFEYRKYLRTEPLGVG